MTRSSILGVFAAAMSLVACGDKYGRDCSEVGPVTYADAQVVFETHCTRCHASTLVGGDRQFAPSSVNFDSYDSARQNAEDGNAMILEGRMPADDPGAVTDPEGCIIEAWIAQDFPE